MGGGYDEALKSTIEENFMGGNVEAYYESLHASKQNMHPTQEEINRMHTAKIPSVVNHPPYYNTGKIEVIDFIEDQRLNFNCGNVIKYLCRSKHKNEEVTDLEKALWYLTRELDRVKSESTTPMPSQVLRSDTQTR